MKNGIEQVKNRSMWIVWVNKPAPLVVSYKTPVGFIKGRYLIEWGYGNYSTTTSCQLTKLARERCFHRVHVEDEKEALAKIEELEARG